MKTIVVTGGPCSGKTSALEALRERMAAEGIPAVFVTEAGTDLILDGVSPLSLGSMLPFQTQVAALQIQREDAARQEALALEEKMRANASAKKAGPTTNVLDPDAPKNPDSEAPAPEALVICDRGICDGAAYLDARDYAQALEANGLTHDTAMKRYDAVFCLESMAHLGDAMYTTQNNSARSENAAEAAALDKRTHRAWKEHPHFHFVPNKPTFAQKADHLISLILENVYIFSS
ncbi:MAG: ATP-binding protein [Eggerthellaceae bacterium]|nr:ATP-binding protein [Eggerthellaceae bacterium]